jgi:hypothetical protein
MGEKGREPVSFHPCWLVAELVLALAIATFRRPPHEDSSVRKRTQSVRGKMNTQSSDVAQAAQNLAKKLGCSAYEVQSRQGWTRPVLVDCKIELKSTLEAYGANWSGRRKAFVFPSWLQLQAALQEIANHQDREP